MTLTTRLCYEVTFKGKRYRITPFFDHVLAVFETFQRKDLSEFGKVDLGVFLLSPKARVKDKEKPEFLNTIFDALIEKAKPSDEPKSMDIQQDAKLIYASFYQAYNIDLFSEQGRLHWTSFCILLQNLPQDSPLMRVIDIRTKPLPKPTKTNQKEIAALLKLKAKYRLETTQEEREQQLQKGLAKIAMTLEAMSNKKN